jgi:hypothetical protein
MGLFDQFINVIDEDITKELDNKETFSPEIVQQIKETYERLHKEREEWLKNKKEQL